MSPATRPAPFALLAGLCVCAALPPWGWWPLAFAGIALLDTVIAERSRRARFGLTFLAGLGWFLPATLWMFDLTPAAYPIASLWFSVLFGAAGAAVPGGRGRRLSLPGAFVLAELIRWVFPFGGVPLAHLAMTQASSPFGISARLFGSLLVVGVVMIGGVTLSALVSRHWRSAAAGLLAMGAIGLGTIVAPTAKTVDTIDVAVIQGGGQQRTRASVEGAQLVFDRHVEATRSIDRDVDLIVWPENVVNPERGSATDGRDESLYEDEARPQLEELANQFDAVILPGWFTKPDSGGRLNFTESIEPDGTVSSRYDKVRTVPFGEFVPLRGVIERFNSDIPVTDVLPGTEPAVLDTSVGKLGISISWEVFFEHRGRDGIANGGQLLVNPTNGASYWLTIVQAQQVASSQLRALETNRWVLQAAPTGFSAVVTPSGKVAERTGTSEQRVLYATIGLRDGATLATRLGYWPMIVLSLLSVGAGRRLARDDP